VSGKITVVYNSDSNFFEKTLGVLHKTISPSTYSCELCKITHGTFGANKEWKAFLNSNQDGIEFLYLSDFEFKFAPLREKELPLVLFNDEIVLSKNEISKMDLEDLISFLSGLKN
jgi:hypothetical protein